MDKNKDREGRYLEEYGVWEDPDGSVRMPTKGFKTELFLIWNKHCVTRHNNCRWEKIYSDHEKARAYEALLDQMLLKSGIPVRTETDVEENEDIPKVQLMGM